MVLLHPKQLRSETNLRSGCFTWRLRFPPSDFPQSIDRPLEVLHGDVNLVPTITFGQIDSNTAHSAGSVFHNFDRQGGYSRAGSIGVDVADLPRPNHTRAGRLRKAFECFEL